MSQTKRHRRRCASTDCRKLFRHASPLALTCSTACRQRLHRVRTKIAAEAEQERVEAEKRVKLEAIKEHLIAAAQERLEAERIEKRLAASQTHVGAPAPSEVRPAPAPAPTHPYSWSRTDDREVTVTINRPTRFPGTPLPPWWH